MITQTKTKEAYLTQAQFDAKQQAGTLTPYEPYNIEGEPINVFDVAGTTGQLTVLTLENHRITLAQNGQYRIATGDVPITNEIIISDNVTNASIFFDTSSVSSTKYINIGNEGKYRMFIGETSAGESPALVNTADIEVYDNGDGYSYSIVIVGNIVAIGRLLEQ